MLAYVRSFDVAGQSAKFDVIVPAPDIPDTNEATVAQRTGCGIPCEVNSVRPDVADPTVLPCPLPE